MERGFRDLRARERIQSVTAIEENQGLEMSVVHCRSGKNGEEWKWDHTDSTFSSLAEKYCKLSVLSEC